jgi:hypothetical protein
MTIPWDDDAVATMDGPDGRDIIIQGRLSVVVPYLAPRSASERQRILISLPDRSRPPYRFEGSELTGLLAALQVKRRLDGSVG